MRIGIFFGGPSREREISFAGGKTAFEHLDKTLFEPVLVFVDSFGRFIRVAPDVLYKPDIRSFHPSPNKQKDIYRTYIESFPDRAEGPVELGETLLPHEFGKHFDFAFLAMHGPDCEDGAIQGLLEWYRIPYSGPGLMGSSVGIDKILQNEMIALANGQQKETATLTHQEWQSRSRQEIFSEIKAELGLPIVVKAPHQGSSIGVAIVQKDNAEEFVKAVNQCFFQMEIVGSDWATYSQQEKQAWAQRIANLDEGIGFPVVIGEQQLAHPAELIKFLNDEFSNDEAKTLEIASYNAEDQVLFETFVVGQEFSCGCIQLNDGQPLALPPTEVIKVVEVFDFNSKYKPGATRKRIPVETSLENNQKIRDHIATVFGRLGMNVCARIDGFLTPDGKVLLHDPNTIPGMSPTSLIFKQMAEIGLNVTQSLTYFIRQSLRERIRTGKDTWSLRRKLTQLDASIQKRARRSLPPTGILFSANDEEYKEARQLFGRLGAEGSVEPIPVLRVSSDLYYVLPLPLMFKDYVEDVVNSCEGERHPLLVQVAREGQSLAVFYGGATQFEVRTLNSLNVIEGIMDWINLSK